MRAIDRMWTDPATPLSLRVLMVDPMDLDTVRGELSGVVAGSCSVTYGYYSDTRTSAQVVAVDPGWVGRTWLRLVLVSGGYEEELGTYAVSVVTVEDAGEGERWAFDCHSVIWSVSEDRITSHWSLGAGSYAHAALRRLAGDAHRDIVLDGMPDYRFGSTSVYEVGEGRASMMHDLCGRSGGRLDCDGHGRFVAARYTPPSERAADWDLDSSRMVIDGSQGYEDRTGEAHNRSIVYSRADGKEVVAYADAPSSDAASASSTGYVRAEVHQESDMSPNTVARARQLARQHVVGDSDHGRERTVPVLWFPVTAGDMVIYKGEPWLVSGCECNLGSWTKRLTLKEA